MSDDADSPSDSHPEPQKGKGRIFSVFDLLWYGVTRRVLKWAPNAARRAAVYDTPEYAARTAELASAAEATANVESLLAAEQADRQKAVAEASRFASRVEGLESDARLRLGQHIMGESNYGVFILGPDNRIILANENARTYAGVDLEEMIGRLPSEIFTGNTYARTYCEVFEANAADLARTDSTLPPNTFEFEAAEQKAPFDIQAHAGTEGGFVVLRPFKTKSLIQRLLQRRPSLVYLSGRVTFDVLLEEHVGTMMNANPEKPFYFDFEKVESIAVKALDSIGKFYQVFKQKGIACVFKNIPEDAVKYLMEQHDVDRVHFRDRRAVKEKSVVYGLTPSTSPG